MLSSKKTISIISAAALALGAAIPAFADVPSTNVGEQTGTGKTTLKLIVDGTEYTGTEEGGNNPDGSDADTWGDNLAFTAPTELSFVVKANGDLLAPSASATYIENESAYGIHVSSVKVDALGNFNIVADASSSSVTSANSISMNVGPATDTNEKIALSSALSKYTIASANVSKWGMSHKDAANNTDRLFLNLDGKAKNLSGTLSGTPAFGKIHWYLTSGGEGTEYLEPAEPGRAFEDYSVNQLRYISRDIRENGIVSEFYDGENGILAYARQGKTLTATLGDGTEKTIRLVDVSSSKGLVFQFDFHSPITTASMNTEAVNTGGWNNSEIRARLNGGDIYNTYLKDLTIDDQVISPIEVTNNSLDYNGGSPQVISCSDVYWLPATAEIYGAWATTPYSGNEGCSHFAYYGPYGLGISSWTGHYSPIASSNWWRLRSASAENSKSFQVVDINGSWEWFYASSVGGINPCFSL